MLNSWEGWGSNGWGGGRGGAGGVFFFFCSLRTILFWAHVKRQRCPHKTLIMQSKNIPFRSWHSSVRADSVLNLKACLYSTSTCIRVTAWVNVTSFGSSWVFVHVSATERPDKRGILRWLTKSKADMWTGWRALADYQRAAQVRATYLRIQRLRLARRQREADWDKTVFGLQSKWRLQSKQGRCLQRITAGCFHQCLGWWAHSVLKAQAVMGSFHSQTVTLNLAKYTFTNFRENKNLYFALTTVGESFF